MIESEITAVRQQRAVPGPEGKGWAGRSWELGMLWELGLELGPWGFLPWGALGCHLQGLSWDTALGKCLPPRLSGRAGSYFTAISA